MTTGKLIDAKVNINNESQTANVTKDYLLIYVQSGNLTGVEKLLKEDVDPNERDKLSAMTALIEAIKFRKSNNTSRQLTRLLIRYRADVNLSDGNCKTPLMYASEKGSITILNELSKWWGINVLLRDNDDMSATSYARNRPPKIKKIISKLVLLKSRGPLPVAVPEKYRCKK